jgi:hypothetical protein
MNNKANNVKAILNGPKGIFCEACGKDCSDEHLITLISKVSTNLLYEHLCTTCAQDVITCLRQALMEALLTDKE